jgi:hypothetical protein
MILRKRKGMALITVVLIAALFLISIIGISAKVITEKKVSNARASSERALVTAETGFSQTLFDMRNVDMTETQPMQPLGVFHYLDVSDIQEIVKNPVNHITDCSEQEYPFGSTDVPYVTYYIKIKRLSGDYDGTWDPDTSGDYDARDIPVQVYSLGTVYRDSTKAEVLARRIVTTECSVVYAKESDTDSTGSSEVFNYGLFSGSDISFSGGAQEANGDIYAGGNIDLGNSPSKVRVNGGTAHAAGQITGSGQTTGGDPPQSGAVEIPFPELDVEYYKDLALKFKTGQPPYDGTVITDPVTGVVYTYSDTTDALVLAVVQSYLGSDDTGNTVDEIQAFYADLRDYSGAILTLDVAQRAALWDYTNSIVYYINPAPGDGTGTAIINGNFECQGTIVINGDLSINGGADIVNGGGLAIFVNGDIIRANGTATLNGLFYATGGITGNGTFVCNGSIVTQDPIDLNGNFTVNYAGPVGGMPNLNITTTVTGNGISQAEQTPSSWEEVSYEEFSSP